MKVKSKYNRWLYKKYSFNTGKSFERIPLIFKSKSLFSPSLYINEGAKDLSKAFGQGLEEKVEDSNDESKRN